MTEKEINNLYLDLRELLIEAYNAGWEFAQYEITSSTKEDYISARTGIIDRLMENDSSNQSR